jgi:hypothetical protein
MNQQAMMRPPQMAGAGSQQMKAMMPGPGGAGMPAMPGAPGMAGAGPGGGGGADEPADFRTQENAVKAFLNALKAKDPVRLREATALRAVRENEGKANEKLFASILEESMSEDEIDELAKKLEGYQIAGRNVAKSSGRLGIILQKSDKGGDILLRTITVRIEKDGWKVVDIGGVKVMPRSMGSTPRSRSRGRGR